MGWSQVWPAGSSLHTHPAGHPPPGVHTPGQLTGAAASVTSPVLSNYVAWPWGAALLPCQTSLVMRPRQKDLV